MTKKWPKNGGVKKVKKWQKTQNPKNRKNRKNRKKSKKLIKNRKNRFFDFFDPSGRQKRGGSQKTRIPAWNPWVDPPFTVQRYAPPKIGGLGPKNSIPSHWKFWSVGFQRTFWGYPPLLGVKNRQKMPNFDFFSVVWKGARLLCPWKSIKNDFFR